MIAVLMAVAMFAQNQTTGGRFQLVQLGDMRRDQFLLDTQTGKMWARVCLKIDSETPAGCAYSAWRIEDVQGITASMEDIRQMSK
jgi:hypothetical protein